MRITFLNQPWDGADSRTGDHLTKALTEEPPYKQLRLLVAWAREGGMAQLSPAFFEFRANGGSIEAIIGIDRRGTSVQALQLLHQLANRVFVFKNNDKGAIFHPKLYLLERGDSALVIIGSPNLTTSGLYVNYETSVRIELDLTIKEDQEVFGRLNDIYRSFTNAHSDIIKQLDENFLERLVGAGLLLDENERHAGVAEAEEPEDAQSDKDGAAGLFGSLKIPAPPATARKQRSGATRQPTQTSLIPDAWVEQRTVGSEGSETFVLSVLDGDLPQRGSSNEIRITKGIRDANPSFWNWPEAFKGPHTETGQFHRDVRIRMGDKVFEAYLKDFPGQKPDGTKASADFRIGSIAPIVQELRAEEDLVILTRSKTGKIDYEAQVVRRTDSGYEEFAEGLIQHTRARSTSTGTYKKYKYVR